MSNLSKSAKDGLVRQMQDITRALEPDAKRILKAHKWNLMNAVDAFYDDSQAMANVEAKERKSAGPDKSLQNLTALFDKYAGKGADQMDFDATQAWCSDLEVELDDVVVLAVAELTQAPTMGYFDRKPWIEGWRKVKKDSVEAQQKYVSQLRMELQSSEDYFKKVYLFCFDYAKETGQKSLAYEIAAGLWPLLLASAPPSMFTSDSAFTPKNLEQQQEYLEAWLDFLKTAKGGKTVSKDVWTLFLDFAATTDPKFESFDEYAAWPSVIDEFVEHCKEKLAAGESLSSSKMEE